MSGYISNLTVLAGHFKVGGSRVPTTPNHTLCIPKGHRHEMCLKLRVLSGIVLQWQSLLMQRGVHSNSRNRLTASNATDMVRLAACASSSAPRTQAAGAGSAMDGCG
eukprot:1148470-Pelagomonas_calceolata.AAC.3